ncbi:hypothetical protein HK102_013301 [Quaeritorhiza haematococci]|nr:hypothetical protein HK102_013301 [Quaeritorhiza haematococci]
MIRVPPKPIPSPSVSTDTTTTTDTTTETTPLPMQSRRKVVFALDGSSHSTHALTWGLQNIVRPEKDHVILMAVGVISTDWQDLVEASMEILGGEDSTTVAEKQAAQQAMAIVQEGESVLTDYFKDDLKQLSYELAALIGDDPRTEITDFVNDQKVDMLVMGSRGMGMIKRALLGSVSDYVVHHVECPVMVIRDNKSSSTKQVVKSPAEESSTTSSTTEHAVAASS